MGMNRLKLSKLMGNSQTTTIDFKEELTALINDPNLLPNYDSPQQDPYAQLVLKCVSDSSFFGFRLNDARDIFLKAPSNFKTLLIFCTNIVASEADSNDQINPKLKGAVLVLTRLIPILQEYVQAPLANPEEVDDAEQWVLFTEDLMWGTYLRQNGPPLILQLLESLSVLFFKPGYTIDRLHKDTHKIRKSLTGINELLIWKGGIRMEKVDKRQQLSFDENRCHLVRLIITILGAPLFQSPTEPIRKDPLAMFMTCKIARNIKTIFFSLVNSSFNYDCEGYNIPYLSAVQRHEHQERLGELSAQLLQVLLSYEPPNQEELEILLQDEQKHFKDVYEYYLREIEENNKEMNLTKQRGAPSVNPLILQKKESAGDAEKEQAQPVVKEQVNEDDAIPEPKDSEKQEAGDSSLHIPAAEDQNEDIENDNGQQLTQENEIPHIFNSLSYAQSAEDLKNWLQINQYCRILQIFGGDHDFKVMADGLIKLLSNEMKVQNTTLPRSIRSIRFQEEILILMWRTVSVSQKFASFLVQHQRFPKLIVALVYILNKSRTDPSKVNILYITIFLLFYLSSSEKFGKSLNVAYSDDIHLPDIPPVDGSVADLLILAVSVAIRKGPRYLDSFSKILTGILCNMSPHISNMSASASESLVRLAQIFSNKDLRMDNNLQTLRTVLDAIDYNLYYQNKNNYQLVISVYQMPDLWRKLHQIQTQMTVLAKPGVQEEEGAAPQGLEDSKTSGDYAQLPKEERKEAWKKEDADDKEEEKSKEEYLAVEQEEDKAQEEPGATQQEQKEQQQANHPVEPRYFYGLRNIIVAANSMASFIKEEQVTSRAGIIKLMKKKHFSLVGEGAGHSEGHVVELSQNLVKSEVYLVRYEQNFLVSNWLTSYIWSVIFTHNFQLPLFSPQHIRLFQVEFKNKN